MVMLVDTGACTVSFGELADLLEAAGQGAWACPSASSGRISSTPCTGSEEGETLRYDQFNTEILQTIHMIDQQHLDIRTITMGISLLDCADPDPKAACRKVYDKIYTQGRASGGHRRGHREGVRHSHRQQAHLRHPHRPGGRRQQTRRTTPPLPPPWTRRPRPCGVNFIGGFSALVQKGMTEADRKLIASIPEALATHGPGLLLRERGLHQGRHQHGRRGGDGPRHQEDWPTAPPTGGGFGCAKLVVFCQRRGGQPLHGRCLPRRGRAGVGHQRGRLRPRRGPPRPCSR